LRERVKEAAVEFSVDLGYARIPVRDYLNMKEGDILVLDNGFQSGLVAKVEGIPKFEGYAGRVKNRTAFKVYQAVKAMTA
jgi:flagellar motor switch protein FliM